MRRNLFLVLKIIAAFIILTSTAASAADKCFNSSTRMNDDAQTIRLKAMDMGWQVSNAVSIAAAGVVKSKAEIYPQDNVEICIREEGDAFQIRVQSKSKDADKANWRKIFAKKIGDLTERRPPAKQDGPSDSYLICSDEVKVGDVWRAKCTTHFFASAGMFKSSMKVGCITLKAMEDSIIEGEKFQGTWLPTLEKRGSIALKSGAIIKVSFKGESVRLSVKKGKVEVMEFSEAKSIGCEDVLKLAR